MADHIGSLAAGKQADIMIVKGDPSKNIQDIENVEIVFKDGLGYDSIKLIESVKGQVGVRELIALQSVASPLSND